MPQSSEDAQAASPKHRAAAAAAALVKDGMAVGLGSGSTAALVVRALGLRVAHEGLRIVGVPTSVATAELASREGIPLRDLDDLELLDVNLDGADEVDPEFRMIKGRGGALLREKIVVSFARLKVTIVTPEKRVERLGLKAPIPIEVSPVGTRHLARRLLDLGAESTLRLKPTGEPYLTDNGNKILDCTFRSVDDPAALDALLHQTIGVFETGLFIGLCDLLIVGRSDRVEEIPSPGSRLAPGGLGAANPERGWGQ